LVVEVVEVIFVDLDVPDVRTVAAAVHDHVTGLPPELRRLGWHLAARSTAVDTDDGLGHRHPPKVARIDVNGRFSALAVGQHGEKVR
jgi:hypothetical protein